MEWIKEMEKDQEGSEKGWGRSVHIGNAVAQDMSDSGRIQGTYSTSNGIRSERSTDYDGDNGSEVQGILQKVNNGLQYGEAGYKDYSPEHMSDESSMEIKGGNQNNGSSTDLDHLAESIANLESAKEALENEVLKFREIWPDCLVNDPVADLPAEFADDYQNPRETSPEPSQSDDTAHWFPLPHNQRCWRQRVEVWKQKMNQIAILEEQKSLASKQTQILNKLGDTERKAVMLNKEAEQLEKFCEDVVSADETLKLQNRVYKYTTCFFMQLVSLAFVLGIFMFQLAPKYVDNIPT
ncbi:WPP domain-interacting protein 2-like [Dorcoceras hygrometricum]|uniref:WPP domain-interacting protein 2-like n=1 Tax=Dorcoceras hygrometricum TaxID=472368 RepID=A0A2Z7ASG7_9LAMI|nr:WPP domain-interacting protein 2-like [Dorcoceras hygrometricum]